MLRIKVENNSTYLIDKGYFVQFGENKWYPRAIKNLILTIFNLFKL